jgi:CheY-like chemotaxis protein
MSKTILVIEDNPQFVHLYEDALSEVGYTILIANDGPQALTILSDHLVDGIILDVMLPGGMNGFDILEQLKRDNRLSHIPVFMLTNLDSEETLAKKIGAAAYGVKSNLSLEQIVTQVQQLVG